MKKITRYTHFLGHLTTGDSPKWASNVTKGVSPITREDAASSLRDARKKGIKLRPAKPFN
jgi:hypothetical protein